MFITNIEGIFCDAIIADDNGNCCFASLWGRNSELLALYGGITTEAIHGISVENQAYGLDKRLQKKQLRMPKESKYGSDLVHSFLFSPMTIADQDGCRILIDRKPIEQNRIWTSVCSLSEIGLLNEWQTPILRKLQSLELIKPLSISASEKLFAVKINLFAQSIFAEMVSEMLIAGEIKETCYAR
ncbi:hypothetical protein [Suttonella ornithocola]|uniref:Uncharacterized protein n=1 Tax=Suttonella ornithocola TaxID=279832 RepID=A0A380MVY3_9GAMM|nr:hypothetical protein [Suttonella ornithocola]SUO96740.1 Uncharacterised protein [Suttonella ornithocola]